MKYLILASLLTFVCLSCEPEAYEPSEGTLYFNSFEDGSDPENFEVTYDKDAPVGGENYSLLISGGCIVPHYEIVVGPFSNEVNVKLATWGKTMQDMSGYLGLYLPNNPEVQLSIEINTPEWQPYESEGTMVIPAGETAILQFNSGGLVAVATHYDLVEIRLSE